MKQEGLSVPARKKRRYGSYLGEISPAPENFASVRALHLANRAQAAVLNFS